jgi:hypothetical protein
MLFFISFSLGFIRLFLFLFDSNFISVNNLHKISWQLHEFIGFQTVNKGEVNFLILNIEFGCIALRFNSFFPILLQLLIKGLTLDSEDPIQDGVDLPEMAHLNHPISLVND